MRDDTAARPVTTRVSPRPSRRRFLRLVSWAAGAAALGLLAVRRAVAPAVDPPRLDDSAPAPLTEPQVRTLLAAATTLLGQLREDHYAAFFRWRAEHLPGHARLYGRFCETLDRAARRTAGHAFAGCPFAVRRALLDPAFRARATGLHGRWLDRVRAREWILYDRHIVAETLRLFAATDAWLRLGYAAWPGTPRGFDRYREPPV